jgi:hypothetical protein
MMNGLMARRRVLQKVGGEGLRCSFRKEYNSKEACCTDSSFLSLQVAVAAVTVTVTLDMACRRSWARYT